MARPPKRRHQCSDEPPENRSQHHRPAKRAKAAAEQGNFSPEFWDNLSKVPLTPRALRELDRRNNNRPRRERRIPTILVTDIGRFARRGGPSLCHLRGYPEAKSLACKMDSNLSSTSRSRKTESTKATTVTPKSRKSSAYGKEFEYHLTDHHIYMNNRRSQPANQTEIQSGLTLERGSLSPSNFSEEAFERFQRSNEDAVFENDVMLKIVPVICGTSSIPNQQNVLFTELTPITDKTAVKPKPDFFDGALLNDLNQVIKNDQGVRSTVIPTKHATVPVAPNFYMEAKGPGGSAAVAQRQACYDGAHGARAMHALQNYGEAEPTYDGNAYAFSSIYHAGTGTLQLYAHHATAPTTPGESPEYHMTNLDAWAMTGNINTFRCGATAFRNARNIAQRHRNSFIEAANTRASQAGCGDVVAPSDDIYGHDSVNYSSNAARQDADEALQQDVAKNCYYDDTVPEGMPQYLHSEDDHHSQEPSQESTALDVNGPSMNFTSSFTTVSTERAHSKRPRQPDIPPSRKKQTSKQQIHNEVSQCAPELSGDSAESSSNDSR
ncbi:hypothetical protein ACQKWADRAFT_61989 [Trichoderma austrokoningii]